MSKKPATRKRKQMEAKEGGKRKRTTKNTSYENSFLLDSIIYKGQKEDVEVPDTRVAIRYQNQ